MIYSRGGEGEGAAEGDGGGEGREGRMEAQLAAIWVQGAMAPRQKRPVAIEKPSCEAVAPCADVDVQRDAALERWAIIKKRAGYCGLCADVLRDFRGHASRRPRCKQHPESRPLTAEELMRLESEFWEECKDPEGAQMRRVAAAKQRQAQAWVPPEVPADQTEYWMNFGRHRAGKGCTIKEVMTKDPGYFKALLSWKNNILEARPDLKAALEKEGLLEGLMAQRPQLPKARAQRMMVKAAEASTSEANEHPEVLKLRRLQQIEASSILQGGMKNDALAVLCPTKKRAKRSYTPTSRSLLPHCSICGPTEHERASCTYKGLQGEGVPQRSLVVAGHLLSRKIARRVSQVEVHPGDFERAGL